MFDFNQLTAGSIFKGYKIIAEYTQKSFHYRQNYICEDGILVVYNNDLVPSTLLIDDTVVNVPYEYYVLRQNKSDNLPVLIDSGYDFDYTWFIVKDIQGQTLREYISNFRTGAEIDKDEDIIYLCNWIISCLYYMWKYDNHLDVRIHLTPDNIYISEDECRLPLFWTAYN